MYRLTVNDEDVELDAKAKIQLSKKLFDLDDISSRGLKFTNAFTLPASNLNDYLLGYPSRLASNNLAFENNQPYILHDENNIVSVGSVVIKSYDENKGIKIQLAEGYDFWVKAGKTLLQDLILHDHDFAFTTANMDALKTKGASVFLTALAAMTGNPTHTALTNYNFTRPCFYWFMVLNEIADNLGYELDFDDVLDNTQLQDVGNISNAEDFMVCDMKRRFQSLSFLGNIDISTGSSEFYKAGNTTISTVTLTNIAYKTSYVIKGTVTSSFDTALTLTFTDRVLRVIIQKGTSFINFRTDAVEIGTTLVISANETVTFDDLYIYTAISEGDIFEEDGAIVGAITNYLVLSDYNLPQQTCKQFLKVLASLFFLDFEVNEYTKTVKLIYLPNKIDPNNVLDLSGQVQRNIEWKNGGMYGQLNSFQYTNDDTVSLHLGDSFFNVQNKNVVESKLFLEIGEYSATDELTTSGENIIKIDIYDQNEKKRASFKDRIVFFDEVGAFGFNAVFNKIAMGVIYSNHYFDFITATKRERSAQIMVKLTKLQFKELSRSPLIYVDFLESNLLVTDINGFTTDGLTKLTVVKYG